MNNTTELNNNQTTEIYYSLKYWYSVFGSLKSLDIVNITLIPIGVIGAILNVLALIVLRADSFNLPFYTYLRAYTYCSVFICLLNSTLFTSGSQQLLKFTNSKKSFEYYCYFFSPLIKILNLYGSFIDIVLSMERIVLLSKKLEWFKKIDPKVVCLIFAIIASLVNSPYWIIFKPASLNVMLNETTSYVIYYYKIETFSRALFYYFEILPYVTEIFPIVCETSLNIVSVILIKKYTENKRRVTDASRRLTTRNSNGSQSPSIMRARRMEVKLTILVIILSILSTL
jgi:hypothetical protein